MVKVIVGTQFGDEGKGRIIELFSKSADVVARYQGGANAGHTLIIDGNTVVFHLVPCGIIYPDTMCVIGNGVVIDPEALINELTTLEKYGFKAGNRFFISNSAHIVMPYHKSKDDITGKIGTTHKGIGPCYEDKYGRRGIRMIELLYPESFKEKLETLVTSPDFQPIYEQYCKYGKILAPYIADTTALMNKWIQEKKEILLEGAQGLLLDIDHGTYPYVTSSNPHAGGACTGLGISPTCIDEVIGVVKAYTSRVGEGPMPTTMNPDIEEAIRSRGKEYGATTGRPRRCGWLDIVLLKRVLMINGIKKIVLTKLDTLDEMPKIKICTKYVPEANFALPELMYKTKPEYEELEGWQTPISGIREYKKLPEATKKYVERISELLDVKIVAICVGPQKDATIFL
jgi:adenylosuccinate synthase